MARALLVIVVFGGLVVGLNGQQSGDRQSVWDGVYTEAQRARGEMQYAESCERCHQSGLDGNAVGEVPALAWESFLSRWDGKTVGELFEVTARSMPKDAPGTLSRRAYVDVIAFILSKNSFPAGQTTMALDPERLKRIVIEKTRPAKVAGR